MSHGFRYGLVGSAHKAILAGLCFWATTSAAAELEILALGDSLTQGYGLKEQDGFVPQLQAWLVARGHEVTVINGGVSGDTTAGGLARAAWSLTPETDAMIVALGGNDLLRGIDPAVSRANLDGILKVAQDRNLEVLLVGMEAPGNYGPDYKAAFDAMYPELAQSYGTLYLDSFFAGLMSEGSAPADLVDFMQSDGIHPNAQGVQKIIGTIGPQVEELIQRSQK